MHSHAPTHFGLTVFTVKYLLRTEVHTFAFFRGNCRPVSLIQDVA
jgi:hypothetical protein